jgi:lipopolysaccharide/colanic/teichoic acid biosynthesis glycosyltransferase
LSWKPLEVFKSPIADLKGTLNRRQFRQLIQYERARADRTGSRFTLITIRLDLEMITPTKYRRFLATLFSHLRDTDQAGWQSDGQLGILLPDTTISGAQQFIRNVHNSMSGFKIIRSFGVSMYPRVGNIQIVIDDEDEDEEYYSTYEKKLEGWFLKGLPAWKRSFDILFGGIGFILLFPVMLVLALFLLITAGRPFLYSQNRVGLGGHLFRITKFRTMVEGAESNYHDRLKMKYIKSGDSIADIEPNDDDLVFGGRLIRSLNLDDLPMLWSVLKGDMSMVGPFPCHPYEAELYLHWHKRRFDFKPGFLGIRQFKGLDRISFKELIRLDIRYQESISFHQDLGIVLCALPLFFARMFRVLASRSENRENGRDEDTEETPSD